MMREIEVADVKYDREKSLALREDVIQFRDAALKGGHIEWAVSLSHVIGWMHVVVEQRWPQTVNGTIHSNFAILDIKKGRSYMRRRIEKAGDDAKIPVVIHGYITRVHSRDDGVSQEFQVEVTSAEEIKS